MIDPPIKEEILRRLQAVEREHEIKILFAVESGSRAWGFASANSDYDVRFVYTHPADWYLAIDLEDKRDVIEYPIVDDIDLNGWDIRKALRLFWKSNPTFIEWIQASFHYLNYGSFFNAVRHLLPTVYNIDKGIHHYRSMAKTNYRGYLQGDLVPLKKYFYVLRPLLAVRWLEVHAEVAPIEFDRLLSVVDDHDLLCNIEALLARKKVAREREVAPPIRRLNAFIEAELERLERDQRPGGPEREAKTEDLNKVFRHTLDEAWSPCPR